MLNPNKSANNVPQNAEKSKEKITFDSLKRDFEKAFASGGDYTTEIQTLADAIANSVMAKVNDPQRKTAGRNVKASSQKGGVSDNGFNPAIVELMRGLKSDRAALKGLRDASNSATDWTIDSDGDIKIEVVDKQADENAKRLERETLSDGVDMSQEAITALLELATKYAGSENWLDGKITVRKLKKRVYTSFDEKPEYISVESTPIQEVFKAVRRKVSDSSSVKANLSEYSYVSEFTADEMDEIYFRLGKCMDIAGYACDTTSGNIPGGPDGYGYGLKTCTAAGKQTVKKLARMVSDLNLTVRQQYVLKYRMQGLSIQSIAELLEIDIAHTRRTLRQIMGKWIDAGYRTPYGWTDTETAVKESTETAKPVAQYTFERKNDGTYSIGPCVGVYESARMASKKTGINFSNISQCARGQRLTAGGYIWIYTDMETVEKFK